MAYADTQQPLPSEGRAVYITLFRSLGLLRPVFHVHLRFHVSCVVRYPCEFTVLLWNPWTGMKSRRTQVA